VCTLAVAWRALADAPVAVAANRDEALDRPAEPPARRTFDGVAAVAPRDARAGGTWLGYNDHGVVVAVTNRWGVGVDGGRSRGLLVGDALAARSAAAARETVERAVEREEYAGFEVVVADADGATLLEWTGRLAARPLAPGVSVVVNVGAALADGETFGDETDDRAAAQAGDARRLRDHLAVDGDERAGAWLDRAGAALGDHAFGACVHGDGFGTRSSSLLALRADGRREYRFADGPPCETPYRAVDEHL
jgi:uncharacterized protein with NRDE domain